VSLALFVVEIDLTNPTARLTYFEELSGIAVAGTSDPKLDELLQLEELLLLEDALLEELLLDTDKEEVLLLEQDELLEDISSTCSYLCTTIPGQTPSVTKLTPLTTKVFSSESTVVIVPLSSRSPSPAALSPAPSPKTCNGLYSFITCKD